MNKRFTTPAGVVSIILALLGILNFILSALGQTPVNVDADSVNLFVTMLFTIVGTAGSIWNNFNFTDSAKIGDALIDKIKAGEIDYNHASDLIRELADAVSTKPIGFEAKDSDK